jgi:hypothetical protein
VALSFEEIAAAADSENFELDDCTSGDLAVRGDWTAEGCAETEADDNTAGVLLDLRAVRAAKEVGAKSSSKPSLSPSTGDAVGESFPLLRPPLSLLYNPLRPPWTISPAPARLLLSLPYEDDGGGPKSSKVVRVSTLDAEVCIWSRAWARTSLSGWDREDVEMMEPLRDAIPLIGRRVEDEEGLAAAMRKQSCSLQHLECRRKKSAHLAASGRKA